MKFVKLLEKYFWPILFVSLVLIYVYFPRNEGFLVPPSINQLPPSINQQVTAAKLKAKLAKEGYKTFNTPINKK